MKNRIILIGFILIHIFCNAQKSDTYQDVGAIKTKEGILLYHNWGKDSFTLNLEGEVDLSKLSNQYIVLDDKFILRNIVLKSDFGEDDREALLGYMKWEWDYLKNEIFSKDIWKVKEVSLKNTFFNNKGRLINFWYYDVPMLKSNGKIETQVKTNYFITFCHNNYIFIFSYASPSGNDNEAKQILLKMVDGIHFYKNGIDLKRLQTQVSQGKNFYKD